MKHSFIITPLIIIMALLPLSSAALAADASAQRQEAWNLLKVARDLIAESKFPEAEAKLLQAQELDPTYPEVYANLGYLYHDRVWPNRTKALEAYGQLLTLRPDREDARRQVKRLFYEGPFPRIIRAPYLAFSSVGFDTDEVRVGGATRGIAYTTSLLFHEDMGLDGAPPKIPVPVTGDRVFATVNRSCYGYTMPADSDRYLLAFALSWPSETLSAGKNHSQLSQRLMHLLLRYHWYARLYLNLPRGTDETKAYLLPQGPTGAETHQNALYFYDAGTPRTAMEWAREAAHEYGHLALPQIGRFVRPEPFAGGELGERLFIQYLAQEAGEVSGEPWPSAAARQALAALWPGEDFAATEYIEKICRTSLDYWLVAGPDAGLLNVAEPGAEAMQYLVGFMLWVQAAHGPDTLRGVLQEAAGSSPTDYMPAYRALMARQAQQGRLTLNAGCLNLKASKLQQPPLEGAMRREQVRLMPGDRAVFHVYLPAAAWTLAPQPAQPELTLTVDGRGPLPLDADGVLPLGRMGADGWHIITLQLSDKGQPVTLEQLILRRIPEA